MRCRVVRSGLRVAAARGCGADEVEQVLAFDVVELQRAGDRVEHLRGGAVGLPALEAGVVVHAHASEVSHLFTAQAGDPARAVG